MQPFFATLAARIERTDSLVCVGLDPDLDRLPPRVTDAELPRWAFNRQLIDATAEFAAAYKPNAAFYEDPNGWRALEETIAYAHGKDVPVIVDAKRADIGTTARQYASLLDTADAVTVSPYMGYDSLRPFLERESKGVFVLCRTSNPGAKTLQDQLLADGPAVFEYVADRAAGWPHDNVGLVVGATAPGELEALRDRVPTVPFLVPGVGAQGGDAAAAAAYAPGDHHAASTQVGLVNSTRSIIFAWEETGPEAFPDAAGVTANRLRKQLNRHRSDSY